MARVSCSCSLSSFSLSLLRNKSPLKSRVYRPLLLRPFSSSTTTSATADRDRDPNTNTAPPPPLTDKTTDANRVEKDVTVIGGRPFPRDEWTNITDRIIGQVGRDLHRQKYHPLCLIKQRITDFFYTNFQGKSMRTPLFSVFDNLSPVVSIQQNFDSLLVAKDHPSRKKADCYYLNQDHLLRAHTSAHQVELIKQGMNNFLVVGDVYRRDEIDRTHYPIFHQVEGVRLCSIHEVFKDEKVAQELQLFEKGEEKRTPEKQESHTTDAVMVMTNSLQTTLLNLVRHLFGENVEARWVETFFPFTHPSWELEVKFNGEWMEMLGCGIMEQAILNNAGAGEKIGWAFGLGLERLAMRLYEIPDIRTFWSVDPGFLHQFKVEDPYTPITYKPVSVFPSCTNDMSFWLPSEDSSFGSTDFYDIVRSVGGDVVEQVTLIDEFRNPKSGKVSHCYRIVYRHMSKTLTQREVNRIHTKIQEAVVKRFRVVIR